MGGHFEPAASLLKTYILLYCLMCCWFELFLHPSSPTQCSSLSFNLLSFSPSLFPYLSYQSHIGLPPCLVPSFFFYPSLGMPGYIGVLRENVTSGHALLALTNSDLERRLGIAHPLHRRRLRLCIEEERTSNFKLVV